jgi:hypothetical protein
LGLERPIIIGETERLAQRKAGSEADGGAWRDECTGSPGVRAEQNEIIMGAL